jgi:hypothetical protein
VTDCTSSNLHQRNAGFHGKYWAGHFIIGRIKNQVKYEEEELIWIISAAGVRLRESAPPKLLVDDNEINQQVGQEILQQMGF